MDLNTEEKVPILLFFIKKSKNLFPRFLSKPKGKISEFIDFLFRS